MPFGKGRFWEIFERIGTYLSYADYFAGKYQGKDMPNENIPALLKGVSGFWGTLDERNMLLIYHELTADPETGKDSDKRVQRVIQRAIANDNSQLRKLEGFLIRNRVTTFLTGLDNPGNPQKTRSLKRIRKYKETVDGKENDVTEEELRDYYAGGGRPNAVKELKVVLSLLDQYGENAAGLDRVILHLRKMRKWPIRKVGEPGFFSWLDNQPKWWRQQTAIPIAQMRIYWDELSYPESQTRQKIDAWAEKVNEEAERRRAKPKSWIRRIMDLDL